MSVLVPGVHIPPQAIEIECLGALPGSEADREAASKHALKMAPNR
jgi:hypothetical protein